MLYEFIGTKASSTKGNLTVSNVCNPTENFEAGQLTGSKKRTL